MALSCPVARLGTVIWRGREDMPPGGAHVLCAFKWPRMSSLLFSRTGENCRKPVPAQTALISSDFSVYSWESHPWKEARYRHFTSKLLVNFSGEGLDRTRKQNDTQSRYFCHCAILSCIVLLRRLQEKSVKSFYLDLSHLCSHPVGTLS